MKISHGKVGCVIRYLRFLNNFAILYHWISFLLKSPRTWINELSLFRIIQIDYDKMLNCLQFKKIHLRGLIFPVREYLKMIYLWHMQLFFVDQTTLPFLELHHLQARKMYFVKMKKQALASFSINQSTVTAVNQAVNRVLTSGKKMCQTFPLSGRDRLLFSRVSQAALSKMKIILNCIIRRFINISKMAVRKSACFCVYS